MALFYFTGCCCCAEKELDLEAADGQEVDKFDLNPDALKGSMGPGRKEIRPHEDSDANESSQTVNGGDTAGSQAEAVRQIKS